MSWHERLECRLGRHWLNHHFNISLTHRYTYTEVPKSACTTIKSNLGRFEMESCGVAPKWIDDFAQHPHGPAHQSPFVKPYQLPADALDRVVESSDYVRFAFVRNPFARVASAYLDKILNNQLALENVATELAELRGTPGSGSVDGSTVSFLEFVTAASMKPPHDLDPHFRPQTLLLADDLFPYTFIGRVERFDSDFTTVMEAIGLPRADYLRHPWSVNAASRIAELFDARSERIVRELYEQDLDRFRYAHSLPTAA